MPYYAVAKGRSAGVYNSWGECKENVNGYPGATYKKFDTKSEAQNFVSSRSEGGYGGSSGNNSGESLRKGGGGRGSYARSDYSSSRSSDYSTRSSSSTTSNYSPSYGGGGVSSSLASSASATKSSAKTERIFVDGAARGNGRESCPKSGYGVYYGPGDSRNSAVPLSSVDDVSRTKPTNQRAELHAMHHALSNIQKEHQLNPGSDKSYEIHTDSKYTKNSIDTWANKWKTNDWKTSTGAGVANKDLIERTHELYTNLKKSGVPIELVHVKGHSGVEGNEKADRLANQGADQM